MYNMTLGNSRGRAQMKDSEFLDWIADRMVCRHRENEYIDFVQKLRRMAKAEYYKNRET